MNYANPPASSSHWSVRGLKLVGALFLGAAVTFGGSVALSIYQSYQQQRVAEVTKFIDVAQQFDGKFTAFMDPFLAGRDDKAERAAVRANIQDQFLALDRAANNLEGAQFNTAQGYKNKLLRVAAELDRAQPAPQAKALMQAVADVEAAEVCVTYFLRDEAGMDTSETDEMACKAK